MRKIETVARTLGKHGGHGSSSGGGDKGGRSSRGSDQRYGFYMVVEQWPRAGPSPGTRRSTDAPAGDRDKMCGVIPEMTESGMINDKISKHDQDAGYSLVEAMGGSCVSRQEDPRCSKCTQRWPSPMAATPGWPSTALRKQGVT